MILIKKNEACYTYLIQKGIAFNLIYLDSAPNFLVDSLDKNVIDYIKSIGYDLYISRDCELFKRTNDDKFKLEYVTKGYYKTIKQENKK